MARTTSSLMLIAGLTVLGATATQADQSILAPLGLPVQGALAQVPVGEIAGGAEGTIAATIPNPHKSDVQDGHDLFIKLNCAGCHGYGATGHIGPSLQDTFWIFGGTPAEIYKSIYEGRAHGMPAWGQALPPRDIWRLVAYIQSLGGTTPPDRDEPAKQGDRVGELVAPELDFEQRLNASPPYPAHPVKSAAVLTGEQIYSRAGCVVCHGLDGQGGVGPGFASDPFLVANEYVPLRILFGSHKMPAFKDQLSDEDIANVASFIRTSWGNSMGLISVAEVKKARAQGTLSNNGGQPSVPATTTAPTNPHTESGK